MCSLQMIFMSIYKVQQCLLFHLTSIFNSFWAVNFTHPLTHSLTKLPHLTYPHSLHLSLHPRSSLGKEEKHTRQGYKTKQKRQAFAKMEEIASNLNIHMLVVQRAKEE